MSAELFQRHAGNPILHADDWPYSVNAVFNCAAAAVDGATLLLVRVEGRNGMSHLCAARSDDGVGAWKIDAAPTLAADPGGYPEELWGIEDPRITRLDGEGTWAIAYTAYSEDGPLVSLATTGDFCEFERVGAVLLPENKDAALFPRRFDGRWVMLHRPVPRARGASLDIWMSYSPDLVHWGRHRLLLRSRRGGWWDASRIGLSTPPMETDAGWLILYHGVRQTATGAIYRVGAALLDIDDPGRVLRRSDEWIFGPREPYERTGDVGDVVFPCGWVRDGDQVRLYYGAADSCIGLATASVSDLVDYVLTCPEPG